MNALYPWPCVRPVECIRSGKNWPSQALVHVNSKDENLMKPNSDLGNPIMRNDSRIDFWGKDARLLVFPALAF